MTLRQADQDLIKAFLFAYKVALDLNKYTLRTENHLETIQPSRGLPQTASGDRIRDRALQISGQANQSTGV